MHELLTVFFLSLFLALVKNWSQRKVVKRSISFGGPLLKKLSNIQQPSTNVNDQKSLHQSVFGENLFHVDNYRVQKSFDDLETLSLLTDYRPKQRKPNSSFDKKRGEKNEPSNKVWTKIMCSVKHVQSIFHQHVKSRIFRRLEMCANYSFLYCYFSHLSCVLFSFFFYFLNISLKMAFFLLYLHSKWYPKFDLFRLSHEKASEKLFFFSELLSTREKPSELHSNFYLLFTKLLFQPNKDRTNQMKTTTKNIINYSAFSVDFGEFFLCCDTVCAFAFRKFCVCFPNL